MPLWSVRRARKLWGFMPPRSMWAHVTLDDEMRPRQLLRRVIASAGDAFDTSIGPIVETDRGLYAIEFALCRTPPEGIVVRKRPAAVLGIAQFFNKRGIVRAFSLSFCLVLVWCLCGACADYRVVFCNVVELG